jgi:hypothetical protein
MFSSLLSMDSSFLSMDSSFWLSLRSDFWSSALRSRISSSASLLIWRISSFVSETCSFFSDSARRSASDIRFFAVCSALPIVRSVRALLTTYPMNNPMIIQTTPTIIAIK